jgi:hypothetical protein
LSGADAVLLRPGGGVEHDLKRIHWKAIEDESVTSRKSSVISLGQPVSIVNVSYQSFRLQQRALERRQTVND